LEVFGRLKNASHNWILKEEDGKEIKETIKKFENIQGLKQRASLKFCIGKENMKDEEIAENIIFAYNSI